MAIGEHHELKVQNLKEFSISNHDTVSHKLRQSEARLLIRGKRQGHAELVIWNNSGPKQVWNIYVLSKARHLKWMETLKALEDLGLKTQAQGRLVRINGELEDPNEWFAFRKLCLELEKQNELSFINLVTPSTTLKRRLLGEIYQRFLFQHADAVDCQKLDQGPWIRCLIPHGVSDRAEIKELIVELSKLHFVHIDKVVEAKKLSNYRLTFHLYKLEQRKEIESDLTIERAAGTLAGLNRKDLIKLAKNDDFVLGEGRFKLSTVATPEIIIRHGKEFNLQMGSDLPYQTSQNNDNVTTLFRFAGLKISGTLEQSALGNILDYQIELSAPASEGAISGNKKSSSILITNKNEITAFSLNYKSQGQHQKSLPFIGQIPVLGVLFSDTQEMEETKIIVGSMEIERL